MIPEPIEAPTIGLTGPEIIEDLAQRVAAELSKSCFLTPICCYQSYSAKVAMSLWLNDFDKVELPILLTIGAPDESQPARVLKVTVASADPSVVRERSGLSEPSLELRKGEAATAPTKRFYTPRRAGERN